LSTLFHTQAHDIFLDGNLFRGHESPPSRAGRDSDSEIPVKFNDVSH
jgi:hypothetical protein